MLSRVFTRVIRGPISVRAVPVAHMSTMDNFKKNEQLMERDFINRSERELLQNLIKKIELAADPESKNHKESISSILSKHNVKADEDLIKDLLAWKRSTI